MKRIFKVTIIAALFLVGVAATGGPIEKNKYFEIIKNIEIYTNLYKMLNTHYVDDIDPGSIMRIGLEAMVGSLDPYTNYISESDIEGYRIQRQGNYIGIGASSKKIDDFITITELFENQAAQKAGLRVGDRIIGVNGRNVEGKSEEEVNDILKGSPGTAVSLEISRPGTEQPKKFDLTRGQVDIPNVPYYSMVDDEVGYVVLTTFTQEAAKNISDAIRELQVNHPSLKSVVLDLRDNGGGLLMEAVNICNLFIPKDEIVVTTKSKVKERDRSFRTQYNPVFGELPVAVLVNNNSASASEIVSGVLQDYDRGVLIGQRTYGKGLVQNTHDIGYNARVKITIAKYYIPSGRCIQSVEYKDGEPLDIPDSQRTPFKTRNGRTVRDGGGVKPDIYFPKETLPPVLKALNEQNLVFDFVTQYCSQIDSIAPVEDYQFSDFDAFIAYTKTRNFTFETETECQLLKLIEVSKKEDQNIIPEITKLQGDIAAAKTNALAREKEAIIEQIELDIAGRYFFEKGRTKMKLKNDPMLEKAVEVLKDKKAYNEVLAKR